MVSRGEAQDGVPWGRSVCPHHAMGTHPWARVHWEPDQEVRGSLNPNHP